MTQAAKVALLVGAGDAIGAAVARRFARGGFAVCVARRDAAKSQALVGEIRSDGGEARAYSTAARKEENVKALFAEVETDVGPIEVCLFNAGSNVSKPLLDTSEKLFFKAWELACSAGFLVGREAASYMTARGAERCSSRVLPQASRVVPVSRLSRPQSSGCVPWRSQWPANSVRRIFMSSICSSTQASIARQSTNA